MKFAISTKNEVLKFGEVRSSSSLKSLFATQVSWESPGAEEYSVPGEIFKADREYAGRAAVVGDLVVTAKDTSE